MSKQPLIYYAVTRQLRENWDDKLPKRQQKRWSEHAAFMRGLADDGFVILGGSLGDGKKVLLIVVAENEQEIATRLADDPWTLLGMWGTTLVERWEIVLDGRQ